MFSQEKLSVQSLCISLCFQWPISPLKTRSSARKTKTPSLIYNCSSFFNRAVRFLSIPWQTQVKYSIHTIFHTSQHEKENLFSKASGRLNLRNKNMAEKEQTELRGCRQRFTAHIGGWQFLFLQISFSAFLKRGLVLERDEDWKAYHNKNFLFYRHQIRKEWTLVLCLHVRWRKQDFPLLLPQQRSQGNVSNNRKLLYKARWALNCLQSGTEEHTRVLRRDTTGRAGLLPHQSSPGRQHAVPRHRDGQHLNCDSSLLSREGPLPQPQIEN